eukprot:COSAG04_NODE_2511_length_3989_cov_3.164010_1_plen_1205_part_01
MSAPALERRLQALHENRAARETKMKAQAEAEKPEPEPEPDMEPEPEPEIEPPEPHAQQPKPEPEPEPEPEPDEQRESKPEPGQQPQPQQQLEPEPEPQPPQTQPQAGIPPPRGAPTPQPRQPAPVPAPAAAGTDPHVQEIAALIADFEQELAASTDPTKRAEVEQSLGEARAMLAEAQAKAAGDTTSRAVLHPDPAQGFGMGMEILPDPAKPSVARVVVQAVAPTGPAHAAGMRDGDTLLAMAGVPFPEGLGEAALAAVAQRAQESAGQLVGQGQGVEFQLRRWVPASGLYVDAQAKAAAVNTFSAEAEAQIAEAAAKAAAEAEVPEPQTWTTDAATPRPAAPSAAFQRFDTDGDGRLSEGEVHAMLDSLGFEVDVAYVQEVLSLFGQTDAHGGSFIEPGEFEHLAEQLGLDAMPTGADTGAAESPFSEEPVLSAAKEAAEAAARAQPEGELQHGFAVAGFSKPALNVAYEAAGQFGGLPLYRELGGGPAGIYWDAPDSNWKLHTVYTEEDAKEGMTDAIVKPPDGAKALPLGECSAECWVDGDWQGQTVTLAALTAEGRVEVEAKVAEAAAAKEAVEAAALAQPKGELQHGFTIAGFSKPELNVVYEAAGQFGGLPLYRELRGGPAGMYWRGSQWNMSTEYTEENAKKSMANGFVKPPDGAKALPLGECSAECWVDGDWHGQTVTLAALTAEGRAEVEVIEQLRAIREAFDNIECALTFGDNGRPDWAKALALLESEAGVAAAREEDKNGRRLLHIAADQNDVPLDVLRKLVEADPAALAVKNVDLRGEYKTPLDLARKSNAAPECMAYLSGENWKLFAAEGAVEAEVIETLRAIRKTFDDIVAALEAEDWPKALALLESEVGAAAVRYTDAAWERLLHVAAQRKDVPLAVLRKLVETDPTALAAKTKDRRTGEDKYTPLELARWSNAAPECLAYLSGENRKLFAAEGAVEAEVIEKLCTIGEADFVFVMAALEAKDWPKALALLEAEPEVAAAAAREADEHGYQLLHYAAEQKGVPLVVLRKLVEAEPAALTAKDKIGKTPLGLARESDVAPECLAYLIGENWKLFAVEGAVEAEVIEKLRAVGEADFIFIKAAIEAMDWPKALALLESGAGAAVAREADEGGWTLLHVAAEQKDVPLAMLRKLLEATPAPLSAKTKGGKTPVDLARLHDAAPEILAILSGENWKLFAAEGAVEAEVIEQLRK